MFSPVYEDDILNMSAFEVDHLIDELLDDLSSGKETNITTDTELVVEPDMTPFTKPIVTPIIRASERPKIALDVNMDFHEQPLFESDVKYNINIPLPKPKTCNHNQSHGVEHNTNVNTTFETDDTESVFEFDADFEMKFTDDTIQNLIDEYNASSGEVSTAPQTSSSITAVVSLPRTAVSGRKSDRGGPCRVRKVRNSRGAEANKKVKMYVDSQTEARISYCLDQLRQNNVYNNNVNMMEYSASTVDGSYIIDRNVYERLLMLFLLPNNMTAGDFAGLQNVDGWSYFTNKSQNLTRLPLRMCGQRGNFYEPFVKRERKVNGKSQREALCPYCQVDFGDLGKSFQDLSGSNYQHHVAKNHGVWNAGYEMPPPVIYKKNNQYSAVCSLCSQHPTLAKTNFNDLNSKGCLESQLIGYYRHHFSKHSIPKKGVSEEEKIRNKAWFITEDANMEQMVYEQVK